MDTCGWIWWAKLDWGTVPAWVGALGSTAAFLLALRIYWVNSLDKRKEQARLVTLIAKGAVRRLGATAVSLEDLRSPTSAESIQKRLGNKYDIIGETHLWDLQIRNLSKEAIGFVEGEIVDANGREIVRFDPFGSVGPEEDKRFSVAAPFVAGRDTGFRLRLRFTDASGRRWARYHYDPVRRLRRWNRAANPRQT